MENETKTYPVLKPADAVEGTVYEAVSARSCPGSFGPQIRFITKTKQTIYVSAKSGIAKGLASGKLVASQAHPLRLQREMTFGDKGPIAVWGLAPKA